MATLKLTDKYTLITFSKNDYPKYANPNSTKENATLWYLGTSQDFLAREDAEEVCREWVSVEASLRHGLPVKEVGAKHTAQFTDSYVYKFRDYEKDLRIYHLGESYTMISAKASFQSALTAMNYVDGEEPVDIDFIGRNKSLTLIIKQNKEN